MKMWKKVLIVIGIILIIFAMIIARKLWIINNIKKKVAPYTEMSNYYTRVENHNGQDNVLETYKKDDKYFVKTEIFMSDGVNRIMNYCNGDTINGYMETKDGNKIVFLNTNPIQSPTEIINYFDELSPEVFMTTVLFSRVASEEYNGKDCYRFNLRYLPNMLVAGDGTDINAWTVYFEKDTGLMLNSGLSNYEYKFDCVTDEDLVEPDISQYEVVQENT